MASLGVSQRFEHQNGGTLSHNKPIPLQVKRAAGSLWIIVACRNGFHDRKARHRNRDDGSFGAACQDYICVAAADDFGGLADRICSGGAGGHNRHV